MSQNIVYVGMGSISILSNIVYAGLRAQGKNLPTHRTLSFIGGFPHTIVSYFAVEEGSQVAYGVDVPCKNNVGININIEKTN
jgi:hypothetical protein